VGETTDIGRVEGNIVVADDRYISPRHARIALRSGAFYLRDLESVNGVFVRIPFEVAGAAAWAHRAEGAAPARDGARDPLRDTTRDEPSRGSGHDAMRNATDPREAPRETDRREADPHAGQPRIRRSPDAGALPAGEANAANQADSEQVLADQELFLVGQQVLRFEVVKHAEEGFGVASENGTLLFGTPASPRLARLSQRTVEGVVRDVFHVRKLETVIGRESGDIVFTDDPFLSRRHAVVRVHPGPAPDAPRRFTIADLGSSNGTFLQVRHEVRLRHGDQFRIGQQLFRFDLDAARAGV
jgi:pSer/pThr/pTyr-binding forkhead associated (FHA) protein